MYIHKKNSLYFLIFKRTLIFTRTVLSLQFIKYLWTIADVLTRYPCFDWLILFTFVHYASEHPVYILDPQTQFQTMSCRRVVNANCTDEMHIGSRCIYCSLPVQNRNYSPSETNQQSVEWHECSNRRVVSMKLATTTCDRLSSKIVSGWISTNENKCTESIVTLRLTTACRSHLINILANGNRYFAVNYFYRINYVSFY